MEMNGKWSPFNRVKSLKYIPEKEREKSYNTFVFLQGQQGEQQVPSFEV